ncbi:MAG: LamG-like jellyroll fold domain-containing protein [Candidatus Jordarchaeaceae archaeon]
MKKILFLSFSLILVYLPFSVSAQDLIAYYSFDDCSAKDLSGYNNNGVIYGATCTEGKTNNALSFDGIDDYISCGNSSILNQQSITILAWIYPKGWGENGMGRIVTKYSSYQFYVYSDGNRLSFYFWNSSGLSNQAWSSTDSIKLNEWQHVAVTYDGQYVKFYINGLLSGQTTIKTGSLQFSSSNLIIGNRENLDRTFNGTLDEIKIYNRVLSSEEIYSEYLKTRQYILSGQLKDKNGNPLRATISFLNKDTNEIISTNQTDENGNYFLSAYYGSYDILYELASGLWIKIKDFNLNQDISDILNYIPLTQNIVSFQINVDKMITLQISAEKSPSKILVNGTELEKVNSLQELKNNSWFYDSSKKTIHLQNLLDCNFFCKLKGFSYGVCRNTMEGFPKPAPLNLSDARSTLNRYSYNLWHKHEVLVELFKNLSDAHPKYASYESIGKTHEGRDIMIFKIGNSEGGRVMWDGCIHGPEDMGSEIMYIMAKWLLESGNETANKILQRNYVLFIPVVNMDSYARQNRNFSACQYGVDLNRNFVTGWRSRACTIGTCTNDTECQNNYDSSYVCRNGTCVNNYDYSGSSSASENETKAMRNAFQKYRPNFYVNTHYGGGPWIGYYSGNNMTLVNIVQQRINEISSQMGVTPYPVRSLGSNGMTIGDANYFGANAWLFEVEAWGNFTYDDIVNIYFPKSLPILIAMCEASEKIVEINPCLNGENLVDENTCLPYWRCCCSS